MPTHCNILHLEDDDDDSLIFERALCILHYTGKYSRTKTVVETIKYLDGSGPFGDRALYPLPGIIVMDNALTGFDLMAWLDQNETFRPLERIMLTGGMSESASEKWLTRGVKKILLKGSSVEDMTLSVQEVVRRTCAIASS